MNKLIFLALLASCSSTTAPDDPADIDAGSNPTPSVDAAPPAVVDAGPPISYPCEPAPTPGHQEVTCPDGLTFDVEATAACIGGACGLILDLHGLSGTGDTEDALTRMRTLAPPAGFVVLQPTSPASVPEWSSGSYDAAVWSFVQAARDRFGIDPDRVHVMGFSQGGMMTLRLLCAHSEEIASVAPSAGGGCFDGGEPAIARAILYTHGTSDAIVTFAAGTAIREGAIASYDLGSGQGFAQGPLHQATRYTNSAGEVMLEFWQHDFTAPPLFGVYTVDGHCLPGPISDEDFRCRDDGQYDHSTETLRFFQEHRR